LKNWEAHSKYVMSVAFRPDGKGMASGGYDDTWKNWNYGLPRGQSHPSDYMVSDVVKREAFACEGHTVCSISLRSLPSELTCFWITRASFHPSRSPLTVDGSSPRRATALHASGMQQLVHGSVR
jgi:WD40 repeat protein